MSKPEPNFELVKKIPSDPKELRAMRSLKTKRNINDLVEDCFHRLHQTNKDFVSLLQPVYNGQSKTGKQEWDYYEAVKILQAFAKEQRISEISDELPAVIGKVLNRVMGRYGLSRQQRRDAFSNPIATVSDGDDETE